MSSLYWSCADSSVEMVLAKLRYASHSQPSMARGNGLCVAIENPDAALIAKTLPMIAEGLLTSGVLVERQLAADEIWIASEWSGRFLIEDALFDAAGLSTDEQSELAEVLDRHFRILFAARFEPESESSDRIHKEALPGEPIPRSIVLDDPARFYGDYADGWIGGANALYAAGLEAARARNLASDLIVLGGPEDFGFSRDTSEDGVNA